MSFSQWLRTNSEQYLLNHAQSLMARQSGVEPPTGPQSAKDAFWMWFFVPIYRCLPWGFRSGVMGMLPGSHRRPWPRKNWRPPAQ